MAKWYSEMYPESSKISTEDYLTRKRIEAILATFTQEMEGYSYCGSNLKLVGGKKWHEV